MASTKLRLNTESALENFFRDTCILGIISSQKQFRLCWHINQFLDFNFRLNSELEALIQKKRKYCFFQIYECSEPIRSTLHYLYSNHYKGEFLIPELKNIDYVWLLKGSYYGENELNLLMNDIRRLDMVQMVTRLQISDIKGRDNLVI